MELKQSYGAARRKLQLFDQVHPSSESEPEENLRTGVETVLFTRAIIESDYILDEGVIENSAFCLAAPLSKRFD
jgi:hypothetical protein